MRRLEYAPPPWRAARGPIPREGPLPLTLAAGLFCLGEYRYLNTAQLHALAWPDVHERQARNRVRKLYDEGLVQYTGMVSRWLSGQGRYPRVWTLTQEGDRLLRRLTNDLSLNPWPDGEEPLPVLAVPRLLHELELADLVVTLRRVWPADGLPWQAEPQIYGTRGAWRRIPRTRQGPLVLAPDLLVLDRGYRRRPILVEYERSHDRDKFWGKLKRFEALFPDAYQELFPLPPILWVVVWREPGPARRHGDRSRNSGLGFSSLAQRTHISEEALFFSLAEDLADQDPDSALLLGKNGVRTAVRLRDLGLPKKAEAMPS